MGYMKLEGTRAIVDCASDPLEFTSPAWVNSHLKDLANAEGKIRTIRYEEEIIVDFDEEKTKVLTEYASLIRQVEGIMLNTKTYGLNVSFMLNGTPFVRSSETSFFPNMSSMPICIPRIY